MEGTSFPMAEEAVRALQQQFATALDGLTRQNVDLQAELAKSRQQAASELAALRQEVRAPQRGSQTTGIGADIRLLGKPGDFSGETVVQCSGGCAGAAVPRLQELMVEAAKAGKPIPNATILEEDDRAASAQLYWMMLMICKGAALNIVFLAGDSEGLEAWRQLTENYESKMRTRFAGQLMSILSFSLERETTEQITAWEREIANYERDSGKVLDDEIKIGTCLLRLPESQLKTHLLMRVDTVKNGQISGAKLLRSLEQFPRLRHSRLRWTLEP